jgi:hypothetical protein
MLLVLASSFTTGTIIAKLGPIVTRNIMNSEGHLKKYYTLHGKQLYQIILFEQF